MINRKRKAAAVVNKMTKNNRIWIGVTLLIVLAFNYGIFSFPLYSKAASLNDKATIMLMDKVKSGKVLKGSEDEYILDIFRREKAALDRKLLILNSLAISLAIIIGSWIAFGFFSRRNQDKK